MDRGNSGNPVLSILIVNYNGMKFLAPCLKSVESHVVVPHEVIVVDNASSDGSVEFLRTDFPHIKLIISESNLGFSGGNNLAAQNAKGKYLLLLNNDTEIQSSVEPLINLMDTRPDAGVLGCRLFYGDKRQQESVGYFPTVWSLILSWLPLAKRFPDVRWLRRLVRFNSQIYQQPYVEADWVSGAFLLTRRDLWNQLRGMDSNYFMYMEDTDYCLRAHRLGQKILHSANCEVIHHEGSGRSWIGKLAVIHTTRSYLVYMRKFFGPMSVFVLRFFLATIFLFRSFCHFLTWVVCMDGEGTSKAAAYLDGTLLLAGVRR